MENNQLKGNIKDLKGNIKETAGNVTSDERLKAEGKADQLSGSFQKAVGNLQESLKEKLNHVVEKTTEWLSDHNKSSK